MTNVAPARKISIILACHENADDLESSLCSILDQQYPNLQLIVVDGSIEDHSTAALRHYRKSIDQWVRQRCANMAQTINVGLACATGDIIAILESGNLYLPGTLARIAALVAPANPWVVGQCQRIDACDQRLGVCFASRPASLASYLKQESGLIPLASSFFDASIFTRSTRLDESLQWCYDHDLAAHLMAAGHEPAIMPAVLAARREDDVRLNEQTAVEAGCESVAVAARHASQLDAAARREVLLNCDHRRRLYALAEAEHRQAIAHSQVVRELLETQPLAMRENISTYLSNHRDAPSLRQAM